MRETTSGLQRVEPGAPPATLVLSSPLARARGGDNVPAPDGGERVTRTASIPLTATDSRIGLVWTRPTAPVPAAPGPMPLTDSEASLERAWGHSPAAFESWPVPGDLPVSKEALAAVLDAAPSESIELMRAARVPGDRMPHVEPPARGADLVRRLARESLVLRLGNLAPILPAAADWVDGYRELVRALFGARAVRRGDVRADLYLASPDAVSRFHADPSHNLVHQARGRRRLRVFSARDARLTGPGMRSRVFLLRGEHPRYRAECEDDATEIELAPGTGAYVPILAGHWVGNGPEPSVSYTISIRTPEVLVEKRCHEFNARLERLGARPATYGRHGLRDRFKARIETLLHHTLPIRARRPDQDVTWDREADSSARS